MPVENADAADGNRADSFVQSKQLPSETNDQDQLRSFLQDNDIQVIDGVIQNLDKDESKE